MRYLFQSFTARKSNKVIVTFSEPTKIKFMANSGLEKYRKNRTHNYWGGSFEESPVIFNVPSDGKWAVVIEKGTHLNPIDVTGSIEISTDEGLVPTALPEGTMPAPAVAQESIPEVTEDVVEDQEEEVTETEEEESEKEN